MPLESFQVSRISFIEESVEDSHIERVKIKSCPQNKFS